VAEIISRDSYNAATAERAISKVLGDQSYSKSATKYGEIVRSEHGTAAAAGAIETLL
jgi:UDP:flavonoid glycosyltransferase YjiC (YdhE family)